MGADLDPTSSPDSPKDAPAGRRDRADARCGRSSETAGASDEEARPPSGGGTGVDAARPVSVYRWRCPICEASGMGIASGRENPVEKAAFSLRQHVRGTDDDDHGTGNVYPRGFEHDDAYRHVSID